MEIQKITSCLWFDLNAEEAVRFYTSLFSNSKIKGTSIISETAAKASGQPKGSVLTVLFDLEGQEFMALNGGPNFKFSPAISLFVCCETDAEINRLWKALSSGGIARMELGKYQFAEKYGWCEDKYGVNWQLMLVKHPQKIRTTFLFVKDQFGQADPAMKFYTSLFKNSKIESVARDEKSGTVLHGRFILAGQEFVTTESPLEHPFTFTPGISLVVHCESQNEIDYFWQKLSADPAAEACGWLKDTFGISWQIVPKMLGEILLENNERKSERIMSKLIHMKKLDLAALELAARGD